MLGTTAYDGACACGGLIEAEEGDMIRMLVGRRHVGESNLRVVRYVLSRLAGGRRSFFKLARRQRRKLIKDIVREHAHNRRIYVQVMGGI